MKDLLDRLVPVPRTCKVGRGVSLWQSLKRKRRTVPALGPEEYRLTIGEGTILVEAATKAGFFYAQQTLNQLRALSPASCPDLVIEDAPVMGVRGYMLDISRCKVPTMEHLKHFVDLLASFKFNQLQLYTEHTFAYAGHEVVWKDSSPMTPDEIRELDTYCANRFIQLVPNQNAFGHMERWLKHDCYRHLAESPDGFQHPITGWRPDGTVLYPDEQAIRLIDGLLDQLLPNFNSEWIHLGCDEPWELGQGRSFERSLEIGRHGLFKEYLIQLHELVAKQDMRMLFWSDELRAEPERINEFPEDMIPVVWGYEANHPFHEECSVYAEHDREFLIAPGDSSWSSFGGRLNNAYRNIKRAAEAALNNGALGMLLTSWGDKGHQQVWPTQLPALLVFSSAAWNHDGLEKLRLAQALSFFVFSEPDGELGAFWETFARLDTHIPVRIHPENSSFPFDAFHEPLKEVATAFKGETHDCLFPAFDQMDACAKLLERGNPQCHDAKWLLEESRLAFDMTFAGLKRGESVLKNSPGLLQLIDFNSIASRYRKVWLSRSRRGGLKESMDRIKNHS